MYRKLFSSVLIGAGASLMLAAASASALTASQTVEREVVVKNPDGTQTVKRQPADKVIPGEKVVYSLHYYNEQEKPAENIVLVMPIPEQIKYIDGSAERADVKTEYSVDGGKTFATRDKLMVRLADGRLVPARAEDITSIRWTVEKPVAPKEKGVLLFAGRLK